MSAECPLGNQSQMDDSLDRFNVGNSGHVPRGWYRYSGLGDSAIGVPNSNFGRTRPSVFNGLTPLLVDFAEAVSVVFLIEDQLYVRSK